MIRCFHCVLIALLIAAQAWAETDAEHGAAQLLRKDLSETARAAGAVQDDVPREEDEFSAAWRQAAKQRDAGQYAAAAEHFRQLALRTPDHPRAGDAHVLAILSVVDLLRAAPPTDQPALLESYERFLREHLEYWPTHASADTIRLWLGKLLVGRREWPAAIAVLQHVSTKSASYLESMPLVVQCYEKQLQQLNDQDPQVERRRAQLLAAATSRLQPIVTGKENRWPVSWSTPQRETAVALARLHLRFAAPTSPYAERLLVAALRGSPNDQLASVSLDALLDTVAAIDDLLTRRSTVPVGERQLGELALAMVRTVDRRRSELDASAARRVSACRAAALAAVGDRPAALAQYAALAAQSPDDGEIQLRYAAFLAASESVPEMREALARWQQVESRSRRGGPRWRRARQARIDLLTRLDESAEAEKLLRLTRLLYPDWDSAAKSE